MTDVIGSIRVYAHTLPCLLRAVNEECEHRRKGVNDVENKSRVFIQIWSDSRGDGCLKHIGLNCLRKIG